MRLSVIIPVYNERWTIQEVLRRVGGTTYDKEIIVVDDGSTDGTGQILGELADGKTDLRVIFHPENRGKGAAIRTALAHVTGDIVLIQDADLEYDPADYPRLLDPILAGKTRVVYGSRFLGKREKMGIWHVLGNRFLTAWTNLLYQTSLTDMETGYKAFATEVLRGVQLKGDRFDFEPEITAALLRQGHKILEVPISYKGRGRKEGKKIGWRDGITATLVLFRQRLG
ncbi:MAG: glycosyltransferase family 2 protein [Firmicutes bacterium]|nr:glycosyltransferase family 2 protein [Bacillota bacterium]MCL5040616.1 glycosyltransferase family 2 protein [Bacillota bacterium]